MKAKIIGLVALALLIAAPVSAHSHRHNHNTINFRTFHSWETNNASWRLRDGDIIISNLDGRDQTVRVTEEGALYVNDEPVKLTAEQQTQMKEFRDLTYEVTDDARAIAKEGVRIGLKGARLGLKAVGGVVKMLLTNYTEDDLDRDLDAEAAKLDVWADALEKKADLIEEKVDRVEALGEQLKAEIPELNQLDWLN